MKSYKEIADSVLKRRDEYFKAKKRRRMSLIKTASSVMGTAAAAFIGLMIYNNSILQDIKPDFHSSHYNATESIATSPVQPTTTDNEEIVTTEIRQTNSEHSHTKTEKLTFTTTAPQETKSSTVKKTALTTETKRTAAAVETKITYVKTTSVKTETNPAVQTQSVPATEIIYTAPTTAITFVTDDPLGGCIGESPMESAPPGASPMETYTPTVVATAPLLTAAVTNATTTTSTTVMETTAPTAETEFSNTETATTPIPEATFPAEDATLCTLYYDKSYPLSPPIFAIGNHSVL